MESGIVLINESVKNKIIEIRGEKVIIDTDVAEIYGVKTMHLNQAVSRNLAKFPSGYIIELSNDEKMELITNCDRFKILKHSGYAPKAFSEKGLYMLATILKSPKATETTLAIIEAFAKMREIKRTIVEAVRRAENGREPKKMIEQVGKLVSDLILPTESDLETIAIESEAEFKFMGVLRLSRKIVKKPKS